MEMKYSRNKDANSLSYYLNNLDTFRVDIIKTSGNRVGFVDK